MSRHGQTEIQCYRKKKNSGTERIDKMSKWRIEHTGWLCIVGGLCGHTRRESHGNITWWSPGGVENEENHEKCCLVGRSGCWYRKESKKLCWVSNKPGIASSGATSPMGMAIKTVEPPAHRSCRTIHWENVLGSCGCHHCIEITVFHSRIAGTNRIWQWNCIH